MIKTYCSFPPNVSVFFDDPERSPYLLRWKQVFCVTFAVDIMAGRDATFAGPFTPAIDCVDTFLFYGYESNPNHDDILDVGFYSVRGLTGPEPH